MPDESFAPQPSAHPQITLNVNPYRIEALSDGVFSITMTVLVFNLKVPENDADKELLAHLFFMWPNFLAYFTSFILLGIYWTGHRVQYHFIRRVDHESQWLKIFFLAAVALFPFATSLLARYPHSRTALFLYGANLTAMGVILYLHWAYATTHRRLVDADLPEGVVTFGSIRCLAAPVGYAIALCFLWVEPRLTLILYAIVPLIYLLPFSHRLLLEALLRRQPHSLPRLEAGHEPHA